MPDYHFYTSTGNNQNLPSYFFNSSSYLNLFAELDIHRFYLIDEQTIVARIHFILENKIALSPAMAPFGGLETSITDVSVLLSFWENIEGTLRNLGIESIEIKSWPDAYTSDLNHFSDKLYLQIGFKIKYIDANFHQLTDAESALQLFQKPERKRLKKCQKHGFTFEKWENADLELAYELLYQFRKAKDIPLNISKHNFKKSLLTLSDKYSLFIVKDKNNIIGISLCVEINHDILYHFCLSADTRYNSFSPSVLLYEGIYNYCKAKSYKLFDFGTASLKGETIEGLYMFKQKLGGTLGRKTTFHKSLL